MEQYLSGSEDHAYNMAVVGSSPTCSTCGSSDKVRNGQCRLCRNEYMRKYLLKRYAERRSEAIEILGGVCAWCGSDEDLEIDHRDRSKKSFDIGKVIGGTSRQRYMAELEKCQLLCSACHLDKTSDESSVPHGGGASGKKNCPCEPCKERKSQYNKNHYASSKGSTPARPTHVIALPGKGS